MGQVLENFVLWLVRFRKSIVARVIFHSSFKYVFLCLQVIIN